ncbi:hypothetical protein [Christiangramia sp. LLG6405-1]|uniref:hypothetical protein n=1 Tax=Christiangramia sp. LLG6405-1 TaxID=3160832 RepID=UPI00386A93DE
MLLKNENSLPASLVELKNRKVRKGYRTEFAVDFRMKANQVYILRVATDREVFSKNVVSARR